MARMPGKCYAFAEARGRRRCVSARRSLELVVFGETYSRWSIQPQRACRGGAPCPPRLSDEAPFGFTALLFSLRATGG
jgi:hypothetical protein